MLRWCISSPMRRAWLMSARRSTPPPARSAAPSTRARLGGEPLEPPDHPLVVGAEAEHRAEPLVDGREGPVARDAVLHHEDRHRGGDEAGHRPHRATAVAGRERDRPALDEGLRGRVVGRPSPRSGWRTVSRPAWSGTPGPSRAAAPRGARGAPRGPWPRARAGSRRAPDGPRSGWPAPPRSRPGSPRPPRRRRARPAAARPPRRPPRVAASPRGAPGRRARPDRRRSSPGPR